VSTDRDVSRIVRSWLEEGVTTLPDRVLDDVLDRVPATPQRRSWWPARRFAQMNTLAKAAIAAAAVIALAVVGYSMLPGPSVGGPGPTPTPTVSPVPSPSPTPATLANGSLTPGTYRVATGQFTLKPFVVTVPEGWSHSVGDGNFISKGDPWDANGVTFATWLISHVYADSCQWEGTLAEATSPAALVTALSTQTGHQTSGPTRVTLAGNQATRLDFSLAGDFDVTTCDNEFVRLWPDAGPNENFGLPIYPGQSTTVYVLDFDGSAMVVVAIRNEDSPATDAAELEAIVESLVFEP